MQKFSHKRLRSWAGLALFAMLAVLTSPALAFACCCGQETTAVQPPHTPAPTAQTPVASHPDCHGHAEPKNPQPQAAIHAKLVATSQGPCLESVCECPHAPESVLTFVETQNTSSFAPLVLGDAVQFSSPPVGLPSSIRFAFASNAARPRGPDSRSRSGRAPPAFSL